MHLCLLEIHTHLLLQAGGQNGQITVELLLLMLLCGLASGSLATMCNASDRNALLAFKAQLIDTEGALNDWDAQTDCCIWTSSSLDFKVDDLIAHYGSWASLHFATMFYCELCVVPQ